MNIYECSSNKENKIILWKLWRTNTISIAKSIKGAFVASGVGCRVITDVFLRKPLLIILVIQKIEEENMASQGIPGTRISFFKVCEIR